MSFLFFFFTAPAPTEIYTLSLHDALPISALLQAEASACVSGLANVLFCALAVHYIVFLFLSLSSKLSVRFCLFTLTANSLIYPTKSYNILPHGIYYPTSSINIII